MTSLRFHDPPSTLPTSQMIWTLPDANSTFFSFRSAKKPTNRLSGDQNGCAAPSDPAMACGTSESSERIHNARGPFARTVVNAIRRPSGEIACVRSNVVPGGGSIVKIDGAAGGELPAGRVHAHMPRITLAPAIEAAIHGVDLLRRVLRGDVSAPVSDPVEMVFEIGSTLPAVFRVLRQAP